LAFAEGLLYFEKRRIFENLLKGKNTKMYARTLDFKA